jgi:hypothetical protein
MLDDPEAPPRTHHRASGAHGASRKPRGPRFGEQFDLFPPKITIESLDPRKLLGARTRVAGLWRVTIGVGDTHVVFRDRHGLYCEAHGASCRAARAVQDKLRG